MCVSECCACVCVCVCVCVLLCTYRKCSDDTWLMFERLGCGAEWWGRFVGGCIAQRTSRWDGEEVGVRA